jgi:thiol:disulfide interchange protein
MRFRLITLFVAAVLFVTVCYGIGRWLDKRPTQWIEYSQTKFSQHKDDDGPILVFVGADWDASSTLVKKVTFEDPSLKQFLRSRFVIAYYADLTHPPSPDLTAFLRRIDRNSTPTLAVYPNGTSREHVVIDGIPTAKQIIESLEPVDE